MVGRGMQSYKGIAKRQGTNPAYWRRRRRIHPGGKHGQSESGLHIRPTSVPPCEHYFILSRDNLYRRRNRNLAAYQPFFWNVKANIVTRSTLSGKDKRPRELVPISAKGINPNN